jgi:hypothetical protein
VPHNYLLQRIPSATGRGDYQAHHNEHQVVVPAISLQATRYYFGFLAI